MTNAATNNSIQLNHTGAYYERHHVFSLVDVTLVCMATNWDNFKCTYHGCAMNTAGQKKIAWI